MIFSLINLECESFPMEFYPEEKQAIVDPFSAFKEQRLSSKDPKTQEMAGGSELLTRHRVLIQTSKLVQLRSDEVERNLQFCEQKSLRIEN